MPGAEPGICAGLMGQGRGANEQLANEELCCRYCSGLPAEAERGASLRVGAQGG